MLQAQVLESLKKQAKQDPALDATLTMFGSRDRARHQVTVRALKQRMNAEGWTQFDESDYQRVLKALANHGVGKLETTNNGKKVVALREISITLQSLGQAVVDGLRGGLEKFRPRNKYEKLKAPVAPAKAPTTPAPAAPTPPPMRRASDRIVAIADTITVQYKGKPVVVNVPEDFSAQEIADFLVSMRSWK